jgi:hypothetical protein
MRPQSRFMKKRLIAYDVRKKDNFCAKYKAFHESWNFKICFYARESRTEFLNEKMDKRKFV